MPALSNCVDCGRTIDASFDFCPICGGDNRPPIRQKNISRCGHNFTQGPFCIRCGVEDGSPMSAVINMAAAKQRAAVLFFLGLALWAIAIWMLAISFSAGEEGTMARKVNTPFGDDIALHPRRVPFDYTREPKLPRIPTSRNSSTYEYNTWPPTMAEIIIAPSAVIGFIVLFMGARLVGRRRPKPNPNANSWRDPTESYSNDDW